MPPKENNGFTLELAGITEANFGDAGTDNSEPCWGVDLANVKFFRDSEMTIEAKIQDIPKDVIEAITGCVPIIRCRECKHRPRLSKEDDHVYAPYRIAEDGTVTEKEDFTCPCLCEDEFFSYIPKDDFFCKYGEMK